MDPIAAEFDGDDPLKSHSQEGLLRAKQIGEKLAGKLQSLGQPVELGEAEAEEVAELLAMLERNGCAFRAS